MISIGVKTRKQILVSLYAFKEIRDRLPIDESVIIDAWMYTGDLETLRTFGQMLLASEIYSMIYYDGKEYHLLVNQNSSYQELCEAPDFPGTKLNKSIHKMIVWPNTLNLETRKKAEILDVFER